MQQSKEHQSEQKKRRRKGKCELSSNNDERKEGYKLRKRWDTRTCERLRADADQRKESGAARAVYTVPYPSCIDSTHSSLFLIHSQV